MKVLHVSKFFPPVMGGIESVAWELVEGLNRQGITTQVLCAHHQAFGVHQQAPAGYDIWRTGSWARVLSTSICPAMPLQLARLARKVDVIHVHMPDPMSAAALWMLQPRAKLVVHWHSDVIRQRRALRLYEPLQRWVLNRADAVLATSPPYAGTSQALQRCAGKVTVVPIGISDNPQPNSTQVAQALRQRFKGKTMVFALGRMTYYKGFDVLIHAAARLPDSCAVMIGGDGELLAEYRSLVNRLGLAGKVHLLGKVLDHELKGHFEACDIFCMPSIVRAEAYGVAMLEAMVMGKPVVATNIEGSGVPWVNLHGLTGLNVSAQDPLALSEALNDLIADAPKRLRMGVAARQRYESEFRADQMTERVAGVYRRLMGRVS